MNQKIHYNAFMPAFFITEYLLFILTTCFFLIRVPHWSLPVFFLLLPALVVYPLLYLVPSAVLSTAAAALTIRLEERYPVLRSIIIGICTYLPVFSSHCLLLLDAGLYFRYAYHINPHVLNIFTTPGGFEGMGLSGSELISLAGGTALLALFHLVILICFMRFPVLSFAGKWTFKSFRFKYAAVTLLPGFLFAVTYFTYTYEHYIMNSKVLLAVDCIPLYVRGTSRSIYKKLGIKQPDRNAVRVRLQRDAVLNNYPQNPIVRKKDRAKYNVVFLACESWAAKLFTPEYMPATAAFAKKGVYFKNHYSGGNVTRQGVFSMLYALPGNYWHSFLAAQRGPLFIDWLLEDGYSMECITSSKFTYPEFDQTVFAQVPREKLHSDSTGRTFERDQRNVKRLIRAIEKGADSGKPFFTFMFFESPHHPYDFPPEAEYAKDYLDPFIATNVTKEDAPKIFKRAVNCARHLDMCLDKVFQTLEKRNLLKNTIVVLAGDHGEEYYEHNYLGHSSSFVNEQTKTTLILYYPGIRPGVYTKMSSHLDIVPMLAKFFGVQNDPADYSCGFDLLASEQIRRRYSLIANWSQIFFAGEKYKSLIPVDAISYAKQVITDHQDNPLPSVAPFYREYNKDLIQVQKDLTRFTSRKK